MNPKIEEIVIEGKTYVPKESQHVVFKIDIDGLQYVVVRTYSAGVHIGYLKARSGKGVTLISSRRIWSWQGANTLTDIALIGTTAPEKCKITARLPIIYLTEAIEIIPTTKEAFDCLEKVPVWTKK